MSLETSLQQRRTELARYVVVAADAIPRLAFDFGARANRAHPVDCTTKLELDGRAGPRPSAIVVEAVSKQISWVRW